MKPANGSSLTPVGGGGTDFRPCFHVGRGQPTYNHTVLVLLTDLYGTLPDEPPPHPVVWASTGSAARPLRTGRSNARCIGLSDNGQFWLRTRDLFAFLFLVYVRFY